MMHSASQSGLYTFLFLFMFLFIFCIRNLVGSTNLQIQFMISVVFVQDLLDEYEDIFQY